MISIKELQYAEGRKNIYPFIDTNEKWRKIDFIQDIKPIYWISDSGKVYNEVSKYIMQGHIVDNGYVVVSFYKTNNTRIYCHIHRLIMLAFVPIENPELYVVNHKMVLKQIIIFGILNGQPKKAMLNMHLKMDLENMEKTLLILFLQMSKFIMSVDVWN